ncbi:MAG: hypothetical protein ACI4QL_04895, partial [Candidatus Fimimonas sp.]
EGKLVDTIVANAKMEIPDAMIEEQIDEYVEDFKYQLMYQGLNIESYYKYTNTTPETLRANYRERAEKSVRTRLVFEEIVKAENIKPTAEEVDAKIKDYADQIGKDFAEFKAGLHAQETAYFENQATTEALLNMLRKENTIA